MNRLQADLDVGIRLELIGHMLTDTFWDGFSHTHTFDEILYILKGPVTLVYGDTSLELNRGDFALVNKGTEHRVTSKEPASFLYIGFQTNLVSLESGAIKVFPQNQTSRISEFAKYLDEISDLAFRDNTPLETFSGQTVMNLLPALFSLDEKGVSVDPKTVLANKVKEYIKRNLDKPIRVDEIAAGLYHSPHYIGNVFAAVYGVTIKEYALQCKMQKALTLLGRQGLSVADTARKLGYDSAHYFSKCFKNHYGFSPSKYPHQSEEL